MHLNLHGQIVAKLPYPIEERFMRMVQHTEYAPHRLGAGAPFRPLTARFRMHLRRTYGISNLTKCGAWIGTGSPSSRVAYRLPVGGGPSIHFGFDRILSSCTLRAGCSRAFSSS